MKNEKQPFGLLDLTRSLQRKVVRRSFKETAAQMMGRLSAGGKNPKRYFQTKENSDLVKSARAIPLSLLIVARNDRLKKAVDDKK